jgi:TusA-related sulfurtransferase
MESFDLRETIISFSLLQITNYFKKMNHGEVLEIIFTDQRIAEDLKCILPELSYELILIEEDIEQSPDFRIHLKKVETRP